MSKIPYLIDLASQRKATNEENYKNTYQRQFFVLAKITVGFLLSALTLGLINRYLDRFVAKDNLMLYTIIVISLIVFIGLTAVELLSFNSVKSKQTEVA
jgi:hypothetical protein